jgi:HTH-type transcriptional regulator/antitoxin HigA
METETIKTKNDYLQSLRRFEEIFQAKQGTAESDEADLLAILIKNYEENHFVIGDTKLH